MVVLQAEILIMLLKHAGSTLKHTCRFEHRG